MHELSFGTWLIHISSVIEWIFTIFVIYKISTYKEYNLFFWLSLAMVPNLIGAMCAITWHIYDNQDVLYGLVTLQGIFTIFVIYKISTFKKYNLFFWLSLAMVPNLIGAMCAITWHIYDNQDALYGLVTLQGIFTFIGNSTLAIASFTIFKKKETYE